MKEPKGQILLVAFMLLLFSSIILGGIVALWQSSLNVSGSQKENLRAFYLAQSGIERGLAEILYKAANDEPNVDAWLESGQSFSNVSLAGGTYSVVIEMTATGPKKDMVEVTSVGKMGYSERKIKLRMLIDEVESCVKSGKSGHCGPPWGYAWGFWSKRDSSWKEE